MTPSLKDFKSLFRDRLLDLLWRQWTALGITGQASPWHLTPVDPEALLLLSCTLARHDARLFDAILDWLNINGHYLNVQRVRRLLSDKTFKGGSVFAAIAASASTSALAVKWARSTQSSGTKIHPADESLFFMPDGKPLPVLHAPDPVFLSHGFVRELYEKRGVALPFGTRDCATLLLKLRALIGVNSRCEILTYLLLNGYGSPRAVARSCGYYPATVIKALAEMEESGFLVSRVEGRQRQYSLTSDAWRTLLLGEVRPRWIAWPALFSALEEIWLFLECPERDEQSPLAQASSLRRILKTSVNDNLAVCGLGLSALVFESYTGEALLPYFITRMNDVLDTVDTLG
ncbi:MAG TPA: winged helix-turn-helix domain-containing protein [Kiritimatiellia bacterium]|nr:winged helix-turn-helix domain-containing protein [Kiritimatiellia bacterium]HPS08578.1 winged helix-turn-helix domain-containing protein [Kiritimatiellia bacterium]